MKRLQLIAATLTLICAWLAPDQAAGANSLLVLDFVNGAYQPMWIEIQNARGNVVYSGSVVHHRGDRLQLRAATITISAYRYGDGRWVRVARKSYTPEERQPNRYIFISLRRENGRSGPFYFAP